MFAWLSLKLVKAIFSPSGDQAGVRTIDFSFVRACESFPSCDVPQCGAVATPMIPDNHLCPRTATMAPGRRERALPVVTPEAP